MKDTSPRVSRRHVLRTAGAVAGAGLTAGIAAGSGCGGESFSATFEGTVGSGNAAERRYVPQSDEPCEITVSLNGASLVGSAMVMHVSTDGSDPREGGTTEYAFWGTNEVTLDDVTGQSIVRIRVEALYGSTEFDLDLTERAGGASSKCTRTGTWSQSGQLTSGNSDTYLYEVRDRDPCSATVQLTASQGADLDLYLTLDGRTPTRGDYDRRSVGRDAAETIELAREEMSRGQKIGILVYSYASSGEYDLSVTETGKGQGQDVGGGGCTVVNERTLTLDMSTDETLRTVYNPRSEDVCGVEFLAETTDGSGTSVDASAALSVNTDGTIPTRFGYDHQTTADTSTGRIPVENVSSDDVFGIRAAPKSGDGTLVVRVKEYASSAPASPDPVSSPGTCGSLVDRRQVTVDASKANELATVFTPEAARDPDAAYPCKIVATLEVDDTGYIAGLRANSDGTISDSMSEAERYGSAGASSPARITFTPFDPETTYGIAADISKDSKGTMTLTIEEWK